MVRDHLEVYEGYSILYINGNESIFREGLQSEQAKQRYERISGVLADRYLSKMRDDALGENRVYYIDKETKDDLDGLVDAITEDQGRALAALTFLLLTIKAIEPEQSIRLHKGSSNSSDFSWQEGISMRTLDQKYVTPFLRECKLIMLNKDGFMMTRTLAENYPYSSLYKAKIAGASDEWVNIVERVECGSENPYEALCYLTYCLDRKASTVQMHVSELLDALDTVKTRNLGYTLNIVKTMLDEPQKGARLFEISIHSFMQACVELGKVDGELKKLSQMRSANKKLRNLGDIEIEKGGKIVEAWDAKYSKVSLEKVLKELDDKLKTNPGTENVGFILHDEQKISSKIYGMMDDMGRKYSTRVTVRSFSEWVNFKTSSFKPSELDELGYLWLRDYAETIAGRREIAPIDEPNDNWVVHLKDIIRGYEGQS